MTVGRINNLFWSNNSRKKPNGLPPFAETKIIKRRPIIYDFMGGRTHLVGDQWNYAIYEDTYYFLQIDKTYSVRRGHHAYVLIRDIWMNILLKNVVDVKGRLTATRREEWLEPNLNRTYPILADPANVTLVPLIDETYDITQHLNYTLAITPLPMVVLSRREIEDFKRDFARDAKRYLDNKKYFTPGRAPILIFAHLKGMESHSYSWKENLKNRLNAFLQDLKNQKGKVFISKVNSSFGGKLGGKYCITWNTGGIGDTRESAKLYDLDLSGLTDIVPLNITSLKPLDSAQALPYMKEVSEDLFKDFYNFKYGGRRTYKIRRRIYFPFTTYPSTCGMAIAKHTRNNPLYYDSHLNRWNYHCPQRVNTSIGSIFLLNLDHVDFTLNYGKKVAEFQVSASIAGSVTINCDQSSQYVNAKSPRISWPYPYHTTRDDSTQPFYRRDPDIFTPLGFLVYAPFNPDSFQGFKCTSRTLHIKYISGFRNSILRDINNGSFFGRFRNLYNDAPYAQSDWWVYTESPPRGWPRFWFNVTHGVEILLLPNGKGYEYAWRAYSPTDKLSYSYPIKALQEGGYYPDAWDPVGPPFGSRERQLESLRRSNQLIDALCMKTTVELPTELNPGDYLFNDLQYWLDTTFDIDSTYAFLGEIEFLDNQYGTSWPKVFYARNNLYLEDFLKYWSPIPEDIKGVAICSTLEGNLEIRYMESFGVHARLHGSTYSEKLAGSGISVDEVLDRFSKESTDPRTQVEDLFFNEQGIYNVDGGTAQQVGYLALRKITGGELPSAEALSKKYTNIAIYHFLKSLDYLVSSDIAISPGNAVGHVLWYTDEDFEGSNGLFFDLKGTDWFLYIKGGRISLIAKNPDNFDEETSGIQTLKAPQKLKELTTLEKVNQKCVLTIHTHERKLKTRFTFKDDRLDLTVSPIKPTALLTPTQYFFLTLKGDFDVIEKDIISVPKEQLEGADQADHLQLENLRIQMLRNDRDYEIQSEKNIDFATEKLEEDFRRREWDLSTEKANAFANSFLNTVKSTLGAISSLAQGPGGVINLAQQGLGLVQTGVNALFQQRKIEERSERLGKDREFAFRQLAYDTLRINTAHRDSQEDSIRKINEVAHAYRKGTINDTALMRLYRQQAKELEESSTTFLTVYTPSAEQLKLLEVHREEFGVDCDIPTAVVTIQSGMSEEVIKFKSLDDEGVIGLTNIKERDYLISALEMGIKVVDLVKAPDPAYAEYVCTNVYQLSRELESRRTQSIRDEVRRGQLTDEIRKLQGEIASKDSDLADLAEKRKKLAELSTELDQLKGEKTQREKDIQDMATRIESLNRKVQEEEFKYDTKNNEYIKAVKEVEDLRARAQALQGEKDHLQGEYTKIQGELSECRRKQAETEEKVRQTIIKTEQDFSAKEAEWKKKISDKETEVAQCKAKGAQELESANASIANLKRDLETAKKSVPKVPPNTCEIMKKISSSNYAYDPKDRESGWSAYMDLVFQIAMNLNEIRLADLDQRLERSLKMETTFGLLRDMEAIPLIDKAMELVTDRGWSRYTGWLERGGDSNGDVDRVIGKVNEIKDLLTNPTLHGIKSVLDEVFWSTYQDKKRLSEELKTSQDLQDFLGHLFPGTKLPNLYEELFGVSPNFFISKKIFSSMECKKDGEGGVDPVTFFSNLTKSTTHDVSNIPKSPTGRPRGIPEFDGKPLDPNKIDVFFKPRVIHYEESLDTAPERRILTSYRFISETPATNDQGNACAYVQLFFNNTDYFQRFFYILILPNMEEDHLKKIWLNRNELWKNRTNHPIYKAFFNNLRSNPNTTTELSMTFSFFNSDNRGFKNEVKKFQINWRQLFGERGAPDAYFLVFIMTLKYPKFYAYRSKTIWILIRNSTDGPERNPFGPLQLDGEIFVNHWSFMNYVYKHVKFNMPYLENTFDHYSTEDLNDFVNRVRNIVKIRWPS